MRADIRIRGRHRLPHDVAELAGDGSASASRHSRSLDEHDLAAELRPGQTSGHTDLGMSLGELVLICRQTEIGLDVAFVDGMIDERYRRTFRPDRLCTV